LLREPPRLSLFRRQLQVLPEQSARTDFRPRPMPERPAVLVTELHIDARILGDWPVGRKADQADGTRLGGVRTLDRLAHFCIINRDADWGSVRTRSVCRRAHNGPRCPEVFLDWRQGLG